MMIHKYAVCFLYNPLQNGKKLEKPYFSLKNKTKTTQRNVLCNLHKKLSEKFNY